MIEPVPQRDRRDWRNPQTADQVAIEAERRHAYLAPYLIDKAE